MYVPGFSRHDPGDLILMCLPAPTGWTWHGQKPGVFEQRAWLAVPVDMKVYGSRQNLSPGEFSQRLSFIEFEKRLRGTLEFIEAEPRPNWKAIVKQHSPFLKSIQESNGS